MENIQTRAKKIIRISRKKTIIFVIIVAVVGILGFMSMNRAVYDTFGTTTKMQINGAIPTTSIPAMENSSMPYYREPYQDTSSIKDTREFMKVSYNSTIRTREVKEAMRDVKNAINEADGRIDSLNETTKYSYVSFVIPKSNFENFKNEIEAITHEKLYTENTSSQNLLSQKQSIEEQQESANASLLSLQNKQKDLSAKHTQTVGSLQKQISSVQVQVASTRATILATSDENTLVTLRNQEYNLSRQETTLKQSLNSENNSYNASNQSLNYQIESVNAQIVNIAKQDTQFTDNVETVTGRISINWVSLWNIAKIFSPVHPTLIIIVLVLIAWYYLRLKNIIPSVEFV